MSLSPELRARMAFDMQENAVFDGDTQYPEACYAFADLAEQETVEMPAVHGFPFKIYIVKAKNRTKNCPLHINIHGGGFLLPHYINDSLWSAWLADRIGGVVVDVDYTTTEFAPHPVALEQGKAAVRYAFAHCAAWDCDAKRISIGGYSAGGVFTIALGMWARDEGLPLCLLVNGYGPADMRYDLRDTNAAGYWKTAEGRGTGFSVLLSDGDPAVMEEPCYWHLGAPDELLSHLPPTLIIAAGECAFRFQNEQLGAKLASLGVEVTMKRVPGARHGFIPHFMDHWEEGADLIVRMIRASSL